MENINAKQLVEDSLNSNIDDSELQNMIASLNQQLSAPSPSSLNKTNFISEENQTFVNYETMNSGSNSILRTHQQNSNTNTNSNLLMEMARNSTVLQDVASERNQQTSNQNAVFFSLPGSQKNTNSLIENTPYNKNGTEHLFSSRNSNTNNQIFNTPTIPQRPRYNAIPSGSTINNTHGLKVILPDGRVGLLVKKQQQTTSGNQTLRLNRPTIVTNNSNAQYGQIVAHPNQLNRIRGTNNRLPLFAVRQVSSISNPKFPMVIRPMTIPPRFPPVTTTSAATSSVQASKTQVKMTSSEMTLKCQKFFDALLSFQKQPDVAQSVKNIIQELIDARISSEEFFTRLQQLIQVKPQPGLISFFNTGILLIRQALLRGSISIAGINPPPPSRSVVTSKANNATTVYSRLIPSSQLCSTTSQVRLRPVVSGALPFISNSRLGTPRTIFVPPGVLPMQQRPMVKLIRSVRQPATRIVSPFIPKINSHMQVKPRNLHSVPNSRIRFQVKPNVRNPVQVPTTRQVYLPKVICTSAPSQRQTQPSLKLPTPPLISETRTKIKEVVLVPTTNIEDMLIPIANFEDINDITSMEDINLGEETQIMLNSISSVGTQERTCEEIYLLDLPNLQTRIHSVLAAEGLRKFDREIGEIISHALEEKLKNLIEDLGVLAEERLKSMVNRYLKKGSASGFGNSSLDLYLNEHIKTAEPNDFEIILKRNKEYRRDKPYIWHLSHKLQAELLNPELYSLLG